MNINIRWSQSPAPLRKVLLECFDLCRLSKADAIFFFAYNRLDDKAPVGRKVESHIEYQSRNIDICTGMPTSDGQANGKMTEAKIIKTMTAFVCRTRYPTFPFLLR
jgi:hypothetical protein